MEGRIKKRTKIILCIAGTLLLALSIALSIICNSLALCAGKISDDGAYTSVMSDIEGISDADPRVVDLAMLGSHDANTYNLTKYKGLSGEVNENATVLYQSVWGLSYRYTKTQVSTIYDQLVQGVRYLHIKGSYQNGEWYGSHSVIDGPMDTYIRDAIKFLQKAPGEIVVLQVQLMYGEGTTISGFLSTLFGIVYGGQTLKDFVPYENIPLGELRYNAVTKNGTQGGAVVVLTGDYKKNSLFADLEQSEYEGKCYGKPGCISAAWYNRMDSSALAEAVDKQSERIQESYTKYSDGFRVMQLNTTPTMQDPIDTAAAWSLVCKAKNHNSEMIEKPKFDDWMKVMPVVLCDFSTSANDDFNKKINEKIMAYNQGLAAEMNLRT